MRKQKLISARDKILVEKFHQLYDVQRIRMDDELKMLGEQVFVLDPQYVYKLIFYNEKNKEYYLQLVGGEVEPAKPEKKKNPVLQLSLSL